MQLESIDYQKILAKEFSSIILQSYIQDPLLRLAIEYLFLATLQGHQCVTASTFLAPKPEDIFFEKECEGANLLQGFFLLKIFINHLNKQVTLPPIIYQEDDFYLQKSFVAQQSLIHHLAAFVKTPLQIKFSEQQILTSISPYRSYLNQEQYDAIVFGLKYNLQILSGGPGTGKSYTVFYLLKTFLEMCLQQNVQPKILVIAPTGKAASILHERLRTLKDQVTIEVSTVHKALKTAFRKDSKFQELFGYDLIVLDEASMVDLSVFAILSRCLPAGARVVFMGDHHQLPPVESSMVFQYLMDCLPCSVLTVSKRVDNRALLELSEKIKLQDVGYFEKFCAQSLHNSNITYIEYGFEEPFEKLLETNKSFSLLDGTFLTPIKNGPWGAQTLNDKMLDMSKRYSFTKMPILVTKNQYDLEIFNGDIGYLENLQEPVVTFFSSEGEKKLPLCLIQKWTSAFALTIHKSQGSEYDHVVLFLPKGAERFGKELLYTAVTRAKQKLTIIAVKGILLDCLKKNAAKHSKFSYQLSKVLQ
jgi:exodeoxyribonuclease V alpha subunit